jgi:hypothetical protein
MHIHTYRPDHSYPPRARRCGSSGGQTTQTDSCSQHNRASRRGGH